MQDTGVQLDQQRLLCWGFSRVLDEVGGRGWRAKDGTDWPDRRSMAGFAIVLSCLVGFVQAPKSLTWTTQKLIWSCVVIDREGDVLTREDSAVDQCERKKRG